MEEEEEKKQGNGKMQSEEPGNYREAGASMFMAGRTSF